MPWRHPGFPQQGKHAMQLAQSGAGSGEMPSFNCLHNGQELFFAQHACATKLRVWAPFDHASYPPNMVVVPVRRHDQRHAPGGVHADAIEIPQGFRLSIYAGAGINDHPLAMADVHEYAFAVTGAK